MLIILKKQLMLPDNMKILMTECPGDYAFRPFWCSNMKLKQPSWSVRFPSMSWDQLSDEEIFWDVFGHLVL